MEEFEENELDAIFRKAIEGKELHPPASVWENVHAKVVHSKQIHSRKQNRKSKLVTGILVLFLVASGVLVWLSKPEEGRTTSSSSAKRYDTITKQSASAPPSYQVPYKNVSGDSAQALKSQPKASTFTKAAPAHASHITRSFADRSVHSVGSVAGGTQKHRDAIPHPVGEVAFSHADPESKADTLLPMASLHSTEALFSEQKVRVEEGVAAPPQTSAMRIVTPLDPRSIRTNFSDTNQLPAIQRLLVISTEEQTPQPVVRRPVADLFRRLSVTAYYLPAWTTLQIKDVSADKRVPNQAVACRLLGIRVGYALSDRLSVQAGISHQEFRLRASREQVSDMQMFTSEKMNDQYYVMYPTVLGTAQLPVSDMGQQPGEVGVKEMSPMQASYWQIPAQIQYTFWQKSFGGHRNLSVYGFAGGYVWLTRRQSVSLHLYSSSYQEYPMKVNELSGTRHSWGWQAGFGGDVSLSRHWHLLAEPTFGRDASSLTKKLPYQSFVQMIGVKTGLRYVF